MDFGEFFDNITGLFAENIVGYLFRSLAALAALLIGFRLIRWVVKLYDRSKAAQRLDPTAHSFVGSALSIGLKVVLVITVAGIVGIPTASIIALLGSVGVAIGMALQGSLSNLAGGLMILLFRPFVQGDLIEIKDLDIGTVTDISIFYTRLLTADNRRIVVPNGTVSNTAITNYTSEHIRRLDLEFCVDYGADSNRVRQILLAVAKGRERIHGEPAPEVVVKGMGDSAVIHELRAYCDAKDYYNEKFAILHGYK